MPVSKLSIRLLISFGVLIIFPILLGSFVLYQKISAIMEQELIASSVSRLNMISEKVESFWAEAEGDFVNIYSYQPLFAQAAALLEGHTTTSLSAETIISDELKRYCVSNRLYDQVFYIAPSGSTYYSSSLKQDRYKLIQSLQENQALMNAIMAQNGKFLPIALQSGDGVSMGMAKMIKNIYGDFRELGMVVVLFKPNELQTRWDEFTKYSTMPLFILNESGQVVYTNNTAGLNGLVDEFPTHQAAQQPDLRRVRLDDSSYVVFSSSGTDNWNYYEFYDETTLMSQVLEVQSYFFTIILFSVAFFIVVSMFTMRYVTKPISQLAHSVDEMKVGNFVPVPYRGADEIGILSRSFNDMQRKIQSLITDIQTISHKETQTEIQLLKMQLNPHFLYNVLGTLNWIALSNHQIEISGVIADISDLLRYSLDKNAGDIVSVRQDVEMLRKYIAIQRLRYPNVHCLINVDARVLDKRIYKLLLQPLVENAFQHGCPTDGSDGIIRITVQGEVNGIWVEIADNGPGIPPQVAENPGVAGGLGIRNVNDRLRLHYGENVALSIHEKGGTRIRFIVPYL